MGYVSDFLKYKAKIKSTYTITILINILILVNFIAFIFSENVCYAYENITKPKVFNDIVILCLKDFTDKFHNRFRKNEVYNFHLSFVIDKYHINSSNEIKFINNIFTENINTSEIIMRKLKHCNIKINKEINVNKFPILSVKMRNRAKDNRLELHICIIDGFLSGFGNIYTWSIVNGKVLIKCENRFII